MSRSQDALRRAEQERDIWHVVDRQLDQVEAAKFSEPIPIAVEDEEPEAAEPQPGLPAAKPLTFDAVLARCSRNAWTPDLQTVLFFGPKESVRGTEEFRALRSRLYQLRERQTLKTLLVTSSVPGEGRSFVAANLAQVMALQPGCRVLLIDADLRGGRLHRSLGTSATPGLSEYLLNEVEAPDALQKGRPESLFFIPCGRLASGPTELIANGRFKSLIDRLGPLFDWVIIDSSAALPVSDACLVSICCDGVLMVVRSASTPFDIVRKAREKFREEQLVGVILNGSDATSQAHAQYRQGAPESFAR